MSIRKEMKITCPQCSHTSDFAVWDSINTTLDPELKTAVRDKSVFTFICRKCGYKAIVDYPVLYHQMEDKLMIYYVNSDDSEKQVFDMVTGSIYSKTELEDSFFMSDYTLRIVRSQNQLLEKLAIFDAGLDDRVVEIIKAFVYAKFSQQYADAKIENIFMYNDSNGKHILEIICADKSVGTFEITETLYAGIVNEYSDKFSKAKEDNLIINLNWVYNLMK